MRISWVSPLLVGLIIGALCRHSSANISAIIMVEPPTLQPPSAPSCKIETCCTTIVLGASWHCFIKCTTYDESGEEPVVRACRGGPTGYFSGSPRWRFGAPGYENTKPDCDDWSIFDGAWGPVDTYCGPYLEGHPDFEEGLPCTEGESAGACLACDCVEEVMCRIEKCCLRYESLPELYGYNSNSSAYTALLFCGVWGGGVTPPLPQQDSPPLGAPGWDIEIPLNECDPCP